MKVVLNFILLLGSFLIYAQMPLYEYRDIKPSSGIPSSTNSERSVVIVHVPDKVDQIRKVGDWQKLSAKAHKAFMTMGIDVVTYVNHYDLVASTNSKNAYSELFSTRNIKNIIFLVQEKEKFKLLIAPFSNNPNLIEHGSEVFQMEKNQLFDLLLQTGREIKRADHENENFLIPAKPNYTSGISIVEKTLLKNYPGILRRSKLSVERFSKLEMPRNASEETIAKVTFYNQEIEKKNIELDTLLKSYPYEYELIDPMSDDDLLRNRRQFVLRNISGQAKTLRHMLDYNVDPSETDFVSIIPIMPDQTKAKPIPKEAIVHKFYIRQNISKNIHVGEWDADTSWQEALRNMIGNLIQEHNVNK